MFTIDSYNIFLFYMEKSSEFRVKAKKKNHSLNYYILVETEKKKKKKFLCLKK